MSEPYADIYFTFSVNFLHFSFLIFPLPLQLYSLMYSSCLKCLSFIGLVLVLISYTSHYINVLCSITLNISSKVVATYTYKVRNDRPHNQHSLLNGIKLVIFTEINDIVCLSLAYISLFNQLWLWSYTYMYSIILFSYNIRSSTFSKM